MKKFYHAIATSNFRCDDSQSLAEMIETKLRHNDVPNVVTNKRCEQFKQFAEGFKFIRESDLEAFPYDFDWSFFHQEEYIVTEIILDTMAFYRGSESAWVRVIKHTKMRGGEFLYLISVVNE